MKNQYTEETEEENNVLESIKRIQIATILICFILLAIILYGGHNNWFAGTNFGGLLFLSVLTALPICLYYWRRKRLYFLNICERNRMNLNKKQNNNTK